MREKYIAGIDIGGTKITASIANEGGILSKVRQETKKVGDEYTVPRQVYDLISKACEVANVNRDEIQDVGTSTCSPFLKDSKNDLEIVTPNICYGLTNDSMKREINTWTRIPYEAYLRKMHQNVKTGGDCITAVEAEHLFGAGIGHNNLIYITVSTGIGAGAIINGRLVLGRNDNALHFGHTIADYTSNARQCGCGNFGCVESIASGTSIEKAYDEPGVSSKEVFERFRNKDTKAIEVIENAGKTLGKSLYSLNAILDATVIIYGGSVMNDDDVFLPIIKKEFGKHFHPFTNGVEFKKSNLGNYLGSMAGFCMVIPKEWIHTWQKTMPWENAPKEVKVD